MHFGEFELSGRFDTAIKDAEDVSLFDDPVVYHIVLYTYAPLSHESVCLPSRCYCNSGTAGSLKQNRG